jgi:hypothetical protein
MQMLDMRRDWPADPPELSRQWIRHLRQEPGLRAMPDHRKGLDNGDGAGKCHDSGGSGAVA